MVLIKEIFEYEYQSKASFLIPSHSYDINPVLDHLIQMLQPVAALQDIRFHYRRYKEPIYITQSIEEVFQPLFTMLTKMLHYLPQHAMITLTTGICTTGYFIVVENSGANLSRVVDIYQHITSKIVTKEADRGSSFTFTFSFTSEEAVSIKEAIVPTAVQVPAYYAQIRKRLTSYFTKSDNLVAVLLNYNTRDALFLKKINALINENIENPQMDANHLSRELNMSRTQLFRKLKPIIRQSPGSYIKSMKLEKAKELFETTDLRVNEVAYKTGFESPANFTKAFTRQFGVKPSLFCRSKNGTKG